jgi:hypothetical protein
VQLFGAKRAYRLEYCRAFGGVIDPESVALVCQVVFDYEISSGFIKLRVLSRRTFATPASASLMLGDDDQLRLGVGCVAGGVPAPHPNVAKTNAL